MKIVLYSIVLFSVFACRKKPDIPNENYIGELSVDLNANSEHIRTQEALIGNFICDALKTQLEKKEIKFDAVMIISGSIRYDQNIRPDGIYKKGKISSEMIDEMLPFVENKVVKVKVTGAELKQIMERSVAMLPLNKGNFLQLSDNISIDVDASQQAQIIDETGSFPIIVTEGERISEVSIAGQPIVFSNYYEIIVIDYIVAGNDGFATFLSIPNERVVVYEEYVTNLVKDYVILNSPIEPAIENRINF